MELLVRVLFVCTRPWEFQQVSQINLHTRAPVQQNWGGGTSNQGEKDEGDTQRLCLNNLTKIDTIHSGIRWKNRLQLFTTISQLKSTHAIQVSDKQINCNYSPQFVVPLRNNKPTTILLTPIILLLPTQPTLSNPSQNKPSLSNQQIILTKIHNHKQIPPTNLVHCKKSQELTNNIHKKGSLQKP